VQQFLQPNLSRYHQYYRHQESRICLTPNTQH